MFCLAVCDISCDEHQHHLPLAVPEVTERSKMYECAPAAVDPESVSVTLTMSRHRRRCAKRQEPSLYIGFYLCHGMFKWDI